MAKSLSAVPDPAQSASPAATQAVADDLQVDSDGDLKLLMKQIMPGARQSLQEQAGFRPLAVLLHQDGTIRRMDPGADAGLPAREVAGQLRDRVRQEVQTGVVRSAAVAADVMMWRSADGEEASNAVSIHVEHQGGYCVDLLIPYKVRRGLLSRITSRPHIIFRKMVAQASDPVFWTDPRQQAAISKLS